MSQYSNVWTARLHVSQLVLCALCEVYTIARHVGGLRFEPNVVNGVDLTKVAYQDKV